MKYMLIMQGQASGWKEFGSWPREAIKRHVEFMMNVIQELKQSGELVDAQGLTGPEEAKIVKAQPGGKPSITDGPFTETKEYLIGYWLVDVPSMQRAIDIAAHISTAPNPTGEPTGLPIEIRKIGTAPEV